MSTPTSTQPTQPSSASKKTAGHVTTPSYLGLSPAPRSVPSPATNRKDHAGKTPVNSSITSSSGSKTIGSTPMMQNLSQTGFTAGTPTPGFQQMVPGGGGSSSGFSFGTPLAGLGVDLGSGVGSSATASGTPGLVSATLMAATVSELGRELGLTAGGGSVTGAKRNEDEERRAKMRQVLKTIGRPKGRVSEEGIARISRRVGFQNDIDAEKLTPEEAEKKVGNRTIVMAGKTILVDVEMRNHVAQNVQVMFDGNGKGLAEQGVPAGKVLLEDLKMPDGVLLNATLDRFASNLDCLARMDRLSERANCFDAVSGLYTSLRRLYELEKEAVKSTMESGAPNRDRCVEMETMCKRSGRPRIHENGKIGLSLDYWKVNQTDPGEEGESNAMDIDEDNLKPTPPQEANVFSLRVEVEHSPAELYPALRISDNWLPETFEVPDVNSDQSIPWQEPDPTYLTVNMSGGQGDSMVIDDTQRLPDLRFVARLDPPIVVPLETAALISNSLGHSMQQLYTSEYYHHMLFNNVQADILLSADGIYAEQNVLNMVAGMETEVQHQYLLDVSKPDWGYRLKEVPFSHPRQLIEIMPILRQWAHLGALIQQVFENITKIPDWTLNPLITVDGDGGENGDDDGGGMANLSFTDLINADFEYAPNQPLRCELTLATSPQPAISIVLPESAIPDISDITIQVLNNGEIVIPVVGAGVDDLEGAIAKAKQRSQALTVCGDVGVWIEWLRHR